MGIFPYRILVLVQIPFSLYGEKKKKKKKLSTWGHAGKVQLFFFILAFIGNDRLSKSRWQVEGDCCSGTRTVAVEQIQTSWIFLSIAVYIF